MYHRLEATTLTRPSIHRLLRPRTLDGSMIRDGWWSSKSESASHPSIWAEILETRIGCITYENPFLSHPIHSEMQPSGSFGTLSMTAIDDCRNHSAVKMFCAKMNEHRSQDRWSCWQDRQSIRIPRQIPGFGYAVAWKERKIHRREYGSRIGFLSTLTCIRVLQCRTEPRWLLSCSLAGMLSTVHKHFISPILEV